MIKILNQLSGLYIREIKTTFRSPAIIVLSIVQPLLWIIFFGSSFASAPRSFLEDFFHTDNYIAFLLAGQLSTSMLFVGMFSSLSLIQDKKSGYLRRILVTPTSNHTIFLSKVLGASTRGMLQVPIVFAGVMLFGVQIPDINGILAFIVSLFLLSLGLSSIYLFLTMKSSDWQIPTVVANFINLPLMFAEYRPVFKRKLSNLDANNFKPKSCFIFVVLLEEKSLFRVILLMLTGCIFLIS